MRRTDGSMSRSLALMILSSLVLLPAPASAAPVRDEHGQFLAPSRTVLSQRSPEERRDYEQKYAVRNLTLAALQRFDVGRLNPASTYAAFFPEQVPVDGTRMPTLRE